MCKIEALLRFLPIFERPDFVAGFWPKTEKGVWPYPEYDEATNDFVEAAYEAGCIRQDGDWVQWKDSQEAIALRDDPQVLAEASQDQLERLLTTLIRQDRFSVGSLLEAFESGLILNILRRAKMLSGN